MFRCACELSRGTRSPPSDPHAGATKTQAIHQIVIWYQLCNTRRGRYDIERFRGSLKDVAGSSRRGGRPRPHALRSETGSISGREDHHD